MNSVSQVGVITAMNLRTVHQRLGTSLVIVVGIAGVVAVLVSMLAMSTGFMKTMRGTGRDDRALVLRAGAVSEQSSILLRNSVDIVADAPGIKRDAEGRPIYSAEVVTLLRLPQHDGSIGSVPLRGIGTNPLVLRPEISVVAGRMFEPTLNEVIVGRRAQELYRGLQLGSEIRHQSAVWKIVGIFESNGDVHESEILTNNAMLQGVIKWEGEYRGVLVMLESPRAFATFKDSLSSNPNLSVDVVAEREYYEEQSRTISRVLEIVATWVGGIMAAGAIFGALNSMYSAVNTRAVEIATLRAIGFNSGPIVTSVLVEAMVLALLGGLLGAFLSWLFFSGYTVSTSAVGSTSAATTRVFNLFVSPELMMTGVIWAALIGFVGGIFPALRAARLPIATALRAV